MKEGKRDILNAAHLAAQEVARELAADTMWNEEGYKYPERKEALDSLADAGFGRFFMVEGGALQPVECGHKNTDPECDSSWVDWAVFNMDEVMAYLEYRGIEPDRDKDEPIVRRGDKCPVCLAKGRNWTVSLASNGYTKCYGCDSRFIARENNALLSVCEDASGLYKYYSGPGRPFSHEPWSNITKRGTRVMVVAYGGYDV